MTVELLSRCRSVLDMVVEAIVPGIYAITKYEAHVHDLLPNYGNYCQRHNRNT